MHPDTTFESPYRALVQASPDAFVLIDFSGTILSANPSAAIMGGFDLTDEMAGLNFFDFISDQDRTIVVQSYQRLLQENIKEPVEAILVRKDGTSYAAELTGWLIRDYGNRPAGIISIIRDISKRKGLEQALAVNKENADKANLLKDAFISNISHEIRTPLNAILGFTELIKEETSGRLSDQTYNYFSIIDFSCNRLIQTVELMLSLSRLQTGMYTPVKKPVDPVKIIQKLIEEYQVSAERKSLSLTFENRCGAIELMTDKNCVSQPISILINNAIEYTHQGSITITMLGAPENWLTITVADTGIGMHPDYIKRIFEPFSQAETGYTRQYRGIGLNLAIAKKLLGTIGADISVVSHQGQGSVFTLKVPVS